MFWMKNMDTVQSETVPWCFTWTCIISPIFFLGKMCQDGCGIALSLQILVHGKTPEPHLFLLAAPGSTGCFASHSTQTPAPALFPYCCHSITSCSPGPTLLSLQSSWLKIVSAVFRHIAFKGGDGVSDKLSNTLKKQRNYFHAPQMRFDHEMTTSSSMFSLWSTFLHTVLCTINLDVVLVHQYSS